MPEVTLTLAQLDRIGERLGENFLIRLEQLLEEMQSYLRPIDPADPTEKDAPCGPLRYASTGIVDAYLQEVPPLRGLTCADGTAFAGIGSLLFGRDKVDPDNDAHGSETEDALMIAQVFMNRPRHSHVDTLFFAVALIAHRYTERLKAQTSEVEEGGAPDA